MARINENFLKIIADINALSLVIKARCLKICIYSVSESANWEMLCISEVHRYWLEIYFICISKGQSEVSRRDFPSKGHSEFGGFHQQSVSNQYESYLQVPMVSGAEFTSKGKSEIRRFEFPLKGRPEIISVHQQQVPHQRDSYLEISSLSRVEFPDQE